MAKPPAIIKSIVISHSSHHLAPCTLSLCFATHRRSLSGLMTRQPNPRARSLTRRSDTAFGRASVESVGYLLQGQIQQQVLKSSVCRASVRRELFSPNMRRSWFDVGNGDGGGDGGSAFGTSTLR